MFPGGSFHRSTLYIITTAGIGRRLHNTHLFWKCQDSQWTWRHKNRPVGLPAASHAPGVGGHPGGSVGSGRRPTAVSLLLTRQDVGPRGLANQHFRLCARHSPAR